MEKNYRKDIIKGIFWVVVVAVIFLILNNLINFAEITNIEYLQKVISSFGILGPLIYMLIMAIAIVISPIPSLPLAAVSGMIWGPILGTLYSVLGAEVGAIVSFIISRKFGKRVVEKMLHKQINFCYKCTEKSIGWIVFLARLFPFFQFDIISYGAGLTNISLKRFAIATILGMIPMTYVFTNFGGGLFFGNFLTITLSALLIVSIFIVPILINKYNFLWLKDKFDKVE